MMSVSILLQKLCSVHYINTDLSANRNLDGFAIASFIVNAGENRLSRPVAGGNVLGGALKSQVVN